MIIYNSTLSILINRLGLGDNLTKESVLPDCDKPYHMNKKKVLWNYALLHLFQHLEQYPLVSKQLREIFGKAQPQEKHHCCGMMAMSEQGLGHPDLDELVRNPQPLTFTIGKVEITSFYYLVCCLT